MVGSSLLDHEEPMAHKNLAVEWKVEAVVLQDHFEPHLEPDHVGLAVPLSPTQV